MSKHLKRKKIKEIRIYLIKQACNKLQPLSENFTKKTFTKVKKILRTIGNSKHLNKEPFIKTTIRENKYLNQ